MLSIGISLLSSIIIDMEAVNPPPPQKCPFCPREYIGPQRLIEHINKEHADTSPRKRPKPTKHKCKEPDCAFKTTARNKLKGHYFTVHSMILAGTRENPIYIPKKKPKTRDEAQTWLTLQSTYQQANLQRNTCRPPSSIAPANTLCTPSPTNKRKVTLEQYKQRLQTSPKSNMPEEEDSLTLHPSPEGQMKLQVEIDTTSTMTNKDKAEPAVHESKKFGQRRSIPLSLELKLMANVAENGELSFDIVNFKLEQPCRPGNERQQGQGGPRYGSMKLKQHSNSILISPIPKRKRLNEH